MDTPIEKSELDKILELELDLSKVSELDLSKKELEDKDICAILDKLTSNINLLKLNLSGIPKIGIDVAICLANYLKNSYKLQSLNLMRTLHWLPEKEFVAIIKSLSDLPNLQELNLGSSCGLFSTESSSKLVADYVATNTTLVNLCLRGNFMYPLFTSTVLESLKLNNTIKVLDVGGCNISDKDVGFIADILAFNDTLTELNLRFNIISNSGATIIFDALKGNNALTSLNLSENHIEDFNLGSKIKRLRKDSGLTLLNMMGCTVCPNKFIKIAEALSKNCTLKSLSISCDFPYDNSDSKRLAVQTAANLLESNYTLTEFYVYDTSVDYRIDIHHELLKLDPIDKIMDRNKEMFDYNRFFKVHPLCMH